MFANPFSIGLFKNLTGNTFGSGGGVAAPVDVLIILGQSNADGSALTSAYPTATQNFYATNNSRARCYYKPTTRTAANNVDLPNFVDDGIWYRLAGDHDDAAQRTHQTVQAQLSTVPIQTDAWAGSEGGAALEYVIQNPSTTKELWIVKAAIGASRIETNWGVTGRTANLIYDYFLNRVWLPARTKLLATGRTIGTVTIFWMQGESDTTLTTYQDSLQTLVNNIIADISPAPTRIIIGGLNAGTGYGTAANVLDTKIRQWNVAVSNPTTQLLVTDGSYGAAAIPVQADQIHFTAQGYETLGRRIYDPTTIYTRKVTPLKNIVPSTVFELDATVGISANSGQVWRNLCTNPADGSGRSAYDYDLGAATTIAADDPTLVGTPDAATTYFSFDGGDFFELSAANTAFLNNLHKTTGGQAFWIATSFLYLDTAGGTNPVIFTTRDFAGVGITLRLTGSADEIQLTQRGSVGEVSSTLVNTPTLVNGTNYLAIISVPAGGGAIKVFINNTTPFNETITYDTSTANASQVARIANGYAGSTFFVNGQQLRSFAMGNAVISDAEAALIFAQLRTRHAQAYA